MPQCQHLTIVVVLNIWASLNCKSLYQRKTFYFSGRKMRRKRFEYEILVNKKVVWRGLDPEKKFDEIRKKYPNKKVGITWKPGKGVLIA